jgi:ribosomal protein L16 Arg81 hydroxylase
VILNRHYNHTSTENRGNGATDVQQYRRYIDMNMVAPVAEYAKTLHDSGFTFEEFAEAYPNLAGSEYGEQLKDALEALDDYAELSAQNQVLAERIFAEEREREEKEQADSEEREMYQRISNYTLTVDAIDRWSEAYKQGICTDGPAEVIDTLMTQDIVSYCTEHGSVMFDLHDLVLKGE